ncbi:LruC domain-containing protein [Leptospira interrogans]|uniref:Putative lipoprotein n=1 Tax=Leptospira interrogans serovar Australis str. 200703203 TaxID=1085541 RepID=N1URL0_LEPIR|nr:LruC domain-containing protein [Leptospira interrogans]EMY24525.1 putative lipoprotein [Leptospira interrogans serovar Australis str. 200703203]EKN88430.1 putative lipoprotein [Leptospira interrogans str. 2002000624]EKQ36641.1 putative lipoprotein [Leptospira interrogans str. 2002000621]EKQ46442.1 putative lipoprotein [Leptospira interrogans str. 2002000623]OOB97266.1 LruC domain-containing protein [Leptospira interrogans serovar Australis]
MKKILILLIALSFVVFGCSHKKKGILLPFLTLLNQDAGASAAKSESSAGTATASNGGSVVIVDNTGSGNNSSGVLLPNNNSDSSSNATTNSQTSENNSSSAGSSNNSSSSGSNSNSGSNNSNSNSGSTSVGSNSDSGSSSGSNTGSSSSSGGDTNTNSGSTNVGSNSDSGSSGSNTGSSSSSGGDTNTNSGGTNVGSNSDSGSSSSNAGSSSSSGSDTSTNSGSTNVGSNSDSGSSGSNAGSSSSSGSDTNTGTGSNNGSSNPSTPSQEITGVITVNDQIGSIPFTYNTVQTIPLNLVVTDKQSKPISGATVIVSDNEGHILFQGISNNIGKVSGTITVETALGQITLEITAAGESISNVINLINVVGINREIKYEVLLPVAAAPTDTDKDGVPDTLDTYPQDPTRSSLIRIPAEGVSTVAYEDLYPSAGDADLNDYVLHIHNEEDLNAAGDVIRLRGTYQHVARGAGYKHTFFLKLPVAVGATFSRKVVREDGKIVTDLTTKTVSSSDLNLGIQIHEESNKTTSNPNVNPGGVYKPGYIATIEIVFNSPVKKTTLGSYPYDIFIKVINTGKEIHFPGLYKNANGTDKYLDSNNFPWAILVPGAWKYPYEGLDIRKDTQTGYKEFNLWVASNGTSYKDWYKHITNQAKVFPVPDEDSELMGFLLRSMKKNAILIAILLIGAGAAVAYILKRRTLSQA